MNDARRQRNDAKRPRGTRRARLEDRRRARNSGYGRFLGLTAIGSLIPGAGLFAAGKRRLATFLIVLLLLLAAAAVIVVALVPLNKLASLAGNTTALPIIGGALVAAAAMWLIVALVTHRSLEPDGLSNPKRLGGALVVVVASSLVVAPLAVSARNVFTQNGVIGAISGGGASHTTPELDTKDPWADKPRLNILFLGGDGGRGRTGVRPDTQILASIDTHTGETTMISLPRNLQNFPFPEDSPLAAEYPNGFAGPGDVGEWLLNAVYLNVPKAHPEIFEGVDNPGADANKWAVEGALGIDVDYYMLVNLEGFQTIVDALGGITVDVPRRIPWGNKSLPDGTCTTANGYIEPGEDQQLDGFQALWFARSRCGSDDYDRMARQRCVMNAIVAKADPATLLTQYQSLAAATKDIVFTDIPEELFPALIELTLKVKGASLGSLTLDDEFFSSMGTTSADPDYDAVHERIAEALAADPAATTPPTTPPATGGPDTTEASGASNDEAPAAETAQDTADEPDADPEEAETTEEPDSESTGEPDQPVDTGSVC